MTTFLQEEYSLKPGETIYVKINGLQVKVRRTKQSEDNTSQLCLSFVDEASNDFPVLRKTIK